jgi:3-phenylpropionate/cinnamic acid dioxygenase small subunit
VSLLEEVAGFLYREARFADEGRYDAWEALWSDDGVYWVPAAGDDPDREMSIIYDNRSRIALRVQQLKTGKRYAQTPPSSVRRMISNIEVLEQEGDHLLVGANFLAVESRPRQYGALGRAHRVSTAARGRDVPARAQDGDARRPRPGIADVGVPDLKR